MHRALISVPEALADVPWREGGWTRKQIVGHLLDSATNNRQRFVRATSDGSFNGPNYAQDAWVAAHGYADQPWETLLGWWEAEHEILMAVVDRIPDSTARSAVRDGRGCAGDVAVSDRGLCDASAVAFEAAARCRFLAFPPMLRMDGAPRFVDLFRCPEI